MPKSWAGWDSLRFTVRRGSDNLFAMRMLPLLLAVALAAAPLSAVGQNRPLVPTSGPDLVLDSDALQLAQSLSIAVRHYIWRRSDGLAEQVRGLALTVTVRCAPAFPRDSQYGDCTVHNLEGAPDETSQRLTSVLNRYLDVGYVYTTRAAQEQLAERRSAAAVITIPLQMDDLLPPADAVAERKVTMAQALTGTRLATRLQEDYPTLAVRNEWEGALRLSCLSNADGSVSCEGLSFDPPEHFEFFRDYVERNTVRLRMPARLSDGSPSAGALFAITLRYEFPEDAVPTD